MTTKIHSIKVDNLFQRNEIFNLNILNKESNPLVELSAIRLETEISMNDNHSFFYEYIQTFLTEYFKNHTLWLFVSCLSAPDNKIARHKKLWKSSVAESFQLSSFSYHSEEVIIENKEKSTIDISALIKVSEKDLTSAIELLMYHPNQTTMFLSESNTFESEENIKFIHEQFYNDKSSYSDFLYELVANNSIVIRSRYKNDQFAPFIDFFMKNNTFSSL